MRMRRLALWTAVLFAGFSLAPRAQGDGGYRLVPNWPTLPAGMYFGLKDAPPPPAEREAQAAARRAMGGQRAASSGSGGPTNQPGISGLAIDKNDRIYVFNRGPKPVMVFNADGQLVMAGADQVINGKTINPSWQHSGAVDWDGNVYIVERDAHRIVKLNPAMDTFLLQLGTTNEKGTDATHLNLPSGIAVLKSGNIVVTDGYGNNRVLLFDKAGKLLKQVGKGAGGPDDKGTGVGEWVLPHKLAVDAQENLYIIDRENKRLQVFDKDLNYLREITNEGWNPWDVNISRRGTDGFAYIADHAGERVHKMRIADGALVATWGSQGLGPGQFDWVHGIVVDSTGAVYAADTYGQRLQKFVAASASR
ncbi:MAG: 6-bladed beta-propeller [Acidobacteriota bacterium]|nr:6-bladed beta-propeller [Acidobacteriota bacterium]